MSKLEIHQFPCLSDNYGVLIHDSAAGVTASIDAPEAEAVRRALAEKGWSLTHILVTHHHADHTDGILPLKEETGCHVVGPRDEAAKIKGLDQTVGDGDKYRFGSFEAQVIGTPGHTAGHISYWFAEADVAFVGDTVFAMGCGRVIEGDHRMMWNSLAKIKRLPPSTMLYCGHEYTVSNAKFALTIEPENAALRQRAAEVEALRAAGKPTLPTTLSAELETNPFLRPDAAAIRSRLAMQDAADWEVFGEVRERKNRA